MSESIRGHDVMEMMIAAKQSFTKESLEQAIVEKFGKDARFHTCSADNMTAKELIDFLEFRDKFKGSNEGFVTVSDKICDH